MILRNNIVVPESNIPKVLTQFWVSVNTVMGFCSSFTFRSLARSKPVLVNEAGISALEFTLVLPLIIILIAGVVQLGNAYHELQVLQQALRHGARVAAHYSSPTAGVACLTLTAAATKATREYLNQNGLYPDLNELDPNKFPWTITPSMTTKVEGGVSVYFINMLGQKSTQVNSCVFCPNRLLSGITPSATASFALRGACT